MNGEQFVAERTRKIAASGIRRIFDLGAKLKDPIDLSIGQPDFAVPEKVQRAMCDAIRSGHNGYTTTRGITALRERIAQHLKSELNWEPDLMVTSGVSGGLLLALTATLNPGDEVLFGDPYFVSYPILVRLAGGTPVPVSLYDDFQLHLDRFSAAITGRTKAIIITSPSNPTGTTFSEEGIRQICALARQKDLLIISDEIYTTLTYDGPAVSPAKYAPERTVMLRGFGKSHALTGLRLGYAAGPAAIIAEMAKLQQFTYVCAPHPGQYGALAALDTDMTEQVTAYRAKRDFVCRRLQGAVEFVKPSGGFYVFPKAPPRFASATAFVEAAIENNLLVIPGEVFSQRDTHFRISYAAPNERLERGCEVIAKLADVSRGR